LAALNAVMGEVAFDCIGKPHTYMANMVLRLTGTTPQDAVFVGDNDDTDGAIARAMGMRFVHVVREVAT
jgi:FMN phosphatase YigB (HAD superfamily)